MDNTTKKCPACGAELPRDAAFCPRCTATLTERRSAAMPHTGSRRLRWLLAGAAVIAAAAAAVFLWPKAPAQPDTPADPYLAACQTYYTAEDGREYHVFTALTPEPTGRTAPVGYHSVLIPDGGADDCPVTVMVEDAVTQSDAAADFAELLESWDVAVNAAEGVGRVKLWEAEEEAVDSPALLYRRLHADNTCTHNEVVWTLRMKNGDVLTLTQTVEYVPQEVREYTPAETPLSTAAELQALLDKLAQECTAETLVTVRLPEVTYDAPITVGCSVTLVGNGTVFTAPVTVTALEDTDRAYAMVRFQQITFSGSGEGSGTGLTAGAPTYFEECRLTGWDVGGEAVNGGWLYLRGGYVGGNTVGVRYDSAYSSSYTYSIRRIDFMNNGLALDLACFPPQTYVSLDTCRFSANGTDITNPNGYRVELVNTDQPVIQ